MKRVLFVVVCGVGFGASAWAQPIVSAQQPSPIIVRAGTDPVPLDSWEYKVVEALTKTKLIEPSPEKPFVHPWTRYEFALVLARLLESSNLLYFTHDGGTPQEFRDKMFAIVPEKAQYLSPVLSASVLTDAIIALRTEFADELRRICCRVIGGSGSYPESPEDRVPAPPKQTLSLGLLHRAGYANYVTQPPTPAAPIPAPTQPTTPTPDK